MTGSHNQVIGRITIRASILLLLGAVVNVAAAWGCAVAHGSVEQTWSPYHNPSIQHPIVIFITRRLGYTIVSGCERSGTLLDRYPESVRHYRGDVWWVQDALKSNTNNYGIASGMPELVLTAWRAARDNDEMQVPGMIHMGILCKQERRRSQSDFPAIPVILPMKPIWPGFVINTIFYAAILWLLFAAPLALRGRLRLKHGLCPACAYPIGASFICTECGKPVKVSSIDPASSS
jgi:hypothetical protein